jgi:hypothetical protein
MEANVPKPKPLTKVASSSSPFVGRRRTHEAYLMLEEISNDNVVV